MTPDELRALDAELQAIGQPKAQEAPPTQPGDDMIELEADLQRVTGVTPPDQRGSWIDAWLQGISLGTYDELAGVFQGPERREALRDAYDAYQSRRPLATMGVEAVAGTLPALAPGGYVARGGSLGAKMARGAQVGAAAGGAYGFNQGEGTLSNDRLSRAVGGAVAGGAVGGALPAVGAGAGALVDAIKRRAGKSPAAVAGVNRPAQREITRSLAEDDMSLLDAQRVASEFGPDAALVDVSPALRSTGEAMVQHGSPGGAALQAMARERSRQAGSRIEGAFDSIIGKRPAPAALVEALKQRTRRNADAAYATARDAVEDPDNIPFNPALRPALDETRGALRRERNPLAEAPDGTYAFLSAAQRRISRNKRADESAAHAGGGSPAYDRAQVLKADESEILTALDNATGGLYSAARTKYADDKALEEAFDYGFSKAMAPSTEISFLRKEWGNMSTGAKVAARAGVRSWLGRQAASVRGGRATARNIFREGDYQDKLRVVFGDETTDKLVRAMDGQEAMWLSDDVLNRATGSRTARSQSSRVAPDSVRVDSGLSIPGAVARGTQMAVNAFRKPDRMTRSLGDALSARGAERDKLIEALIQSQNAQTGFGADASPLIRALIQRGQGAATVSPAMVSQPEDLANVLSRLTSGRQSRGRLPALQR